MKGISLRALESSARRERLGQLSSPTSTVKVERKESERELMARFNPSVSYSTKVEFRDISRRFR